MSLNPEYYHNFEKTGKAGLDNCPKLFTKFAEYADACGLGNANDFRRHIEIAAEISTKYDIPVDKVYLLFSKTASKPISKFPKESPIREKAIQKISESINRNIRVPKRVVEYYLYEEGVPIKQETVSPARVAKKVMADPAVVSAGDLKSKIYALKSALTPGQIQILNDVMKTHGHDDEIGAISLVLIWAKERMSNE